MDELLEEVARLRLALEAIRDGMADTGSTRGTWMTRITKPQAYKIAHDALAEKEG